MTLDPVPKSTPVCLSACWAAGQCRSQNIRHIDSEETGEFVWHVPPPRDKPELCEGWELKREGT